MHIASISTAIDTNEGFELSYNRKVRALIASQPVNRGPAHATTDETMALTHELMHVTEVFAVGAYMGGLQSMIQPNLPWAEDHFQERVGGYPLNPAPSEAWWPFARAGNAEHKKDEKFSHTYPERFWPVQAGENWHTSPANVNLGIRFEYGDFDDLIQILRDNPNSRQAYLPIWFPEDLAAAAQGERVPCSMGYHFIMSQGKLDCVYTMRSCDIVRFYRDDLYMAGRLLQLVASQINQTTGKLVVHIDNLHCFPGDVPMLNSKLGSAAEGQIYPSATSPVDRSAYNWGALG